MCHAFGCRKHTKLVPRFRGLFCPKHVAELQSIRVKIKSSNDELKYRTEEMLFRKFFDEGHVHVIRLMEISEERTPCS